MPRLQLYLVYTSASAGVCATHISGMTSWLLILSVAGCPLAMLSRQLLQSTAVRRQVLAVCDARVVSSRLRGRRPSHRAEDVALLNLESHRACKAPAYRFDKVVSSLPLDSQPFPQLRADKLQQCTKRSRRGRLSAWGLIRLWVEGRVLRVPS